VARQLRLNPALVVDDGSGTGVGGAQHGALQFDGAQA
jgi:hypothetical protein